jgi:hypothetical protein
MAITLTTHPHYRQKQASWDKWRKLYEGKHDELVADLDIFWKHYSETKKGGDDLFRERKQRTRYFNIPEIVISIWTSFFFREQPELSARAIEILGDAVENANGKGTRFSTLLKESLEHYLIYGKAVAWVDSIGKDYRFANLINPLDLVDWDIEQTDPARLGQYNAARIVYKFVPARSRLTGKVDEEIRSDELYLNEFGRYTRQVYKLAGNEKGKILSESSQWEPVGEPIESELTRLPIIDISTESWIKDVCEETLRHFNLRSSKDSIEHNQGFEKIFFIGIDPKDTDAITAISEHRYPILPKDADVKSIAPVNTESIGRSINNALDNAFKVGLNQLRQVAGESKEIQSAESIEAEKDDRIALVEATLSEIESLGNRIIELFAEFQGLDAEEAFISLNKEITVEDMDQFIAMYQAFANKLQKYPEIELQTLKKVISRMFSGRERDDLIQIIDDRPPEREEGQSRQFSLGAGLFNGDGQGSTAED